MKAICPTNPHRKRFATTAHVMQDWEVDENGAFIEVIDNCIQVTHGPNIGNIWTCCECGSEATILED